MNNTSSNTTWNEKAKQALTFIREANASEKYINRINNCISQFESYKLIVPILGGFNAGKSSLLNAVLEKEYLPTNITPETAIAAELYYGDDEKIIACNSFGAEKEFKLTDISKISSTTYDYIKVYVQSDFLKTNPDIVLVDMPGMDSNIESHNKAILRYLPKAQAIVVLSDIEHGTLKNSILTNMFEFQLFESEVALLISKVDLKPKDERNEILKRLQEQIQNISTQPIHFGKIAATSGDIEDFTISLSNFNHNNIFDRYAHELLSPVLIQAARSIEIQAMTMTADTKDIEAAILELRSKKLEFNSSCQRARQSINDKFCNEVFNAIIADLESTLIASAHQLSEAQKGGAEAFKAELIKLIRPTLIASTKEHCAPELEATLRKLDLELSSSMNIEDLFSKFDSLKALYLENKMFWDQILKSGLFQKMQKLISKIMLKLPPILKEAAIIIFKVAPFLMEKFGKSSEEKMRTDIIPQVVEQLKPELKNILLEIANAQFNTYEKQVEDDLLSIEQGITAHQKERVEREKNTEEQAEHLLSISNKLTSLIA